MESSEEIIQPQSIPPIVDYVAIKNDIKELFAKHNGKLDKINANSNKALDYEVESDGSANGYQIYTNEYMIYFKNNKKGPTEFTVHTREFRFGTQSRMPALDTFVTNRSQYI